MQRRQAVGRVSGTGCVCMCVCVSTELFILSSWRDYKHGMVVASGQPSVGESRLWSRISNNPVP
jgi:hypothetical protein